MEGWPIHGLSPVPLPTTRPTCFCCQWHKLHPKNTTQCHCHYFPFLCSADTWSSVSLAHPKRLSPVPSGVQMESSSWLLWPFAHCSQFHLIRQERALGSPCPRHYGIRVLPPESYPANPPETIAFLMHSRFKLAWFPLQPSSSSAHMCPSSRPEYQSQARAQSRMPVEAVEHNSTPSALKPHLICQLFCKMRAGVLIYRDPVHGKTRFPLASPSPILSLIFPLLGILLNFSEP